MKPPPCFTRWPNSLPIASTWPDQPYKTQWLFHVSITLLVDELIQTGFCPPLPFPPQNLHAYRLLLLAIMHFILIQFISISVPTDFCSSCSDSLYQWCFPYLWVRQMLLTLCYLFILISAIPRIRICLSAWWFPFEYYYSQSAVKHLTAAAHILQLQNNSLCGSALNTLHHISTI